MTEAPPATSTSGSHSPGQRAALGALLWLAGIVWVHPDPFAATWAVFLLCLAPLVIVPIALGLLAGEPAPPLARRCLGLAGFLQLPAAVLLAGSFFLSRGPLAALLAAPWLATTAAISAAGFAGLMSARFRPSPRTCIAAGQALLVVGGAWTLSDRLGFRPLDFDPLIVLLTGIHFHYAGFALPLATGLALRTVRDPLAPVAGLGVVLGVPLVAVGITAAQLGWGSSLECLAAWVMALGGASAAWLHLRLALEPGRSPLVRALWALAALSLAASMALAAAYGSRAFAPLAGLDIPRMRVLHGTTNALGFAAASLCGWWLALRRRLGE